MESINRDIQDNRMCNVPSLPTRDGKVDAEPGSVLDHMFPAYLQGMESV